MIDLMGKKYYFFALSILLILTGVVGYIINGGFVLDIQFQGGTILEMQMNDGNFDKAKAEAVVMDTIHKKATVQMSESYNASEAGQKMYFMVVNISSKDTLNGDQENKIVDALRSEFNIKPDAQMSVRNVQPSIGKEIMKNGLTAIFWASLLMVLYIWWRFQIMSGLSAGVMAIVALLHDILIVLSVYAIFRIPMNESFIAAILTILGYSINDTIIIYDRIRENSNLLRKMPVGELVNRSIIQTLSRSINTVVAVLLSIITVYVFAVLNNIASLKEFSLPLIVGITSGCYSSIFVAGPLWVLWKDYKSKKKVAAKKLAKA